MPGTGLVMVYRAVENCYVNTYPPGQIEIAIYSQDADAVAAWISKHSGPPTSSDPTRYWTPVTNQAAVTVAGQTGVSFDWVPDMMDKTIHATAIFLGTAYVLVIQWWSTEASYATTLHSYYQRMLTDLKLT
jgi:hypothetical protein